MTAKAFEPYVLGVPDLDKQHWQMFLILGMLDDCFNPEVACHLVDALIDGWSSHRDMEERYMYSVGYPCIQEHLAEHDALTEKTALLKKRIYEDIDVKGGKFYSSLIESSLKKHIDIGDRDFVEWGRKHQPTKKISG